MKARGGLEREIILVGWQPPLQDYFERDLESDTVTCLMGQALLYDDSEKSGNEKDSSDRRYRRLAACPKCGNRWHPCPDQDDPSRRVRPENRKHFKEQPVDWSCAEQIFFPTNHATFRRRFVGGGHNSSVLSKPNQQHLRKRNTSVEHPYGTVKRWRGANYLLTKGKVKVADETGLSFLAYNFRRAVNLQGTDKLLQIIGAG